MPTQLLFLDEHEAHLQGARCGLPIWIYAAFGGSITEELSLFNDLLHLRWDHRLPGRIARLQFRQRVRRKNPQIFAVEIGDLDDEVVVDQIAIKRLQIVARLWSFVAVNISPLFSSIIG